MLELFDKFRIIKCIKENDYSAVYLAEHVFLDKSILLKTLETKELKDPAILERFKAEGKILAQLDHPNIIKVLDFGIWQQTFYISFEYFKGKNLRDYLNKPKPVFTPEKILSQICIALKYAHALDIIHRDLKPENILINDQGVVKIADFGLAIMSNDALQNSRASVIGTPAYMSPEQIRGERLSSTSDLFSLGIIIFELYSGRNPFLGKDTGETLNNILQSRPVESNPADEILPVDILQLAKKLLIKDARKRKITAAKAFTFFDLSESEKPEKMNKPVRLSKLRPSIIYFSIVMIALFMTFLIIDLVQRPDVKDKISDPILSLKNKISTDSVDSRKRVYRENIKNSNMEIVSALAEMKNPTEVLPGELIIECLPWASIRVDSLEYDTTPLSKPIKLSAGIHDLSLSHPNYPVYSKKISIIPEEILTIRVNLDTLMGYLDCQIYPWGEVFVNNRSIGQTPLSEVYPLSPGEHKVVVRNPQFTDHQDRIQIFRGDTLVYKYYFKQAGISDNLN